MPPCKKDETILITNTTAADSMSRRSSVSLFHSNQTNNSHYDAIQIAIMERQLHQPQKQHQHQYRLLQQQQPQEPVAAPSMTRTRHAVNSNQLTPSMRMPGTATAATTAHPPPQVPSSGNSSLLSLSSVAIAQQQQQLQLQQQLELHHRQRQQQQRLHEQQQQEQQRLHQQQHQQLQFQLAMTAAQQQQPQRLSPPLLPALPSQQQQQPYQSHQEQHPLKKRHKAYHPFTSNGTGDVDMQGVVAAGRHTAPQFFQPSTAPLVVPAMMTAMTTAQFHQPTATAQDLPPHSATLPPLPQMASTIAGLQAARQGSAQSSKSPTPPPRINGTTAPPSPPQGSTSNSSPSSNPSIPPPLSQPPSLAKMASLTTEASPSNTTTSAASSLKWEVDYIPLLVSDKKFVAENPCQPEHGPGVKQEQQDEESVYEINLASFINNKDARSNKKWKSDKSKRIYLPEEYNLNTPIFRRTVLSPILARACAQAGFGITMKGWEKGLQAIRFVCNRNRKGCGGHKSSTTASTTAMQGGDDSGKKVTNKQGAPAIGAPMTCTVINNSPGGTSAPPSPTLTHQPNQASAVVNDSSPSPKKRKRYVPPRIRPTAAEEVCPFSFYIYWEPASPVMTSKREDEKEPSTSNTTTSEKGRWFIVNNGAGCCVHMGHARKLPSEIRIKNNTANNKSSNQDGGSTAKSQATPIPATQQKEQRAMLQQWEKKHKLKKLPLAHSDVTASSTTTKKLKEVADDKETTSTSSTGTELEYDDVKEQRITSRHTELDRSTSSGSTDSSSSHGSGSSITLPTVQNMQEEDAEVGDVDPMYFVPLKQQNRHKRQNSKHKRNGAPPNGQILQQEQPRKQSGQQQQSVPTRDDNRPHRELTVAQDMMQLSASSNEEELRQGLSQCGAFEVLMPLYQEMTCLVGNDPERAHYAITQLQAMVEHFRQSGEQEDNNGGRRGAVLNGR